MTALNSQNAAAFDNQPFVYAYNRNEPTLKIVSHYSFGNHARHAVHIRSKPEEMGGCIGNDAALLTEELFRMAKTSAGLGGAVDVVVGIPGKHARDRRTNVVVQTKDTSNEDYKKNIEDVLGSFFDARKDWLIRHHRPLS